MTNEELQNILALYAPDGKIVLLVRSAKEVAQEGIKVEIDKLTNEIIITQNICVPF